MSEGFDPTSFGILAVFADEADMRLTALSEHFMDIERGGDREVAIAAIFREAHTLKGSAAVVGLDAVASLAHLLEDVLSPIRDRPEDLDAQLLDALLAHVDAIRAVVTAAVAGEEHDTLVVSATATLSAYLTTKPAATERRVPARKAKRVAPQPAPPEPEPVAAPVATALPEHSAPAATGSGAESLRVPIHRLDTVVRLVGEASAASLRLGGALIPALGRDPGEISEFRSLARALNQLQEAAIHTRMVAVDTVATRLRRAVRDLGRQLGKDVEFELRGGDTELDRAVLDSLADPLLHIVRNAVDHGVEPPDERRRLGKPPTGTVRLHAMQLGSEVVLAVSDDGRGVNIDAVRQAASARQEIKGTTDDQSVLYWIFRSGVSTAREVTDISGRGVGLDVVRAGLDPVRGRIEVQSTPGVGTEFRLSVPITLATIQCLVVKAGGQEYAMPMYAVRAVLAPQPMAYAEGRPMTLVAGQPVHVGYLSVALGTGTDASGPTVVVSSGTRTYAFRVDELVGQRDVVVKGVGKLIGRLEVVAGVSVEPDGSILVVLEPTGTIARARRISRDAIEPPVTITSSPGAHASVVIVDDALTVRELQYSILTRAGYNVRAASDAREALALIGHERPDLLITDVQMPGMDGFALTEVIRADEKLHDLPIIIISTRSSEADRKRGLEAGANRYIPKSSFDEIALLQAVEQLVGQR